LDFVRGIRPERFAASPVFTNVFTQQRFQRRWLGQSTDAEVIEDIVSVGRDCGFIPFFEVLWFEAGVMDYEVRDERSGERRNLVKTIRTPHGEHVLVDTFEPFHSRHVSQYAFSSSSDLDAYEYFIRRSIDRIEQCRPRLQAVIEQTSGRAVPYFTAGSPHRCFSLISSQDLIFLYMDEPDRMERICALNDALQAAAVRIAADCGFKVFFSGTEGTLYSPALLRRYALPHMLERRRLVRDLGALYYLHECGRMGSLRADGFYTELCPDILEGFQPPPSGDVTDLAAFVAGFPEGIVSKGNVDLNFLLDRSAVEVRDAGVALLRSLPGRRHILGGSCSALPGTPLDNFRAIVEAVDIANSGSPGQVTV
jgi:hypothetical protein